MSEKPKSRGVAEESAMPSPPVLAFTVCVVAGWVGMFLLDWWWSCVGLVAGIIMGDVVEAFVNRNAPPPGR